MASAAGGAGRRRAGGTVAAADFDAADAPSREGDGEETEGKGCARRAERGGVRLALLPLRAESGCACARGGAARAEFGCDCGWDGERDGDWDCCCC